MSSFEVIGGKQLKGSIVPQGAKNEALQILSAAVLTKEPVTISNIPDILDVNLLIELLQEMGVVVNRINQDTYQFQANDIQVDYLASEDFRKKSGRLRGSVMLAGPLLARFKKAYLCQTVHILPHCGGWVHCRLTFSNRRIQMARIRAGMMSSCFFMLSLFWQW